MTATFERVKVDRISPHSRNVRRDLGDLTELAASIKAQGLLQPLVVAPVAIDAELQRQSTTLQPQRYVLIAGHRRHAAAVQAGVESLPCIVRDDLDTQAKQIEAMVVENVMRSDLTVMEEADAYAQLELLGVKQAAIAKTTGRSRATVHQRLLLASLPTERREAYESGLLTLDGAVLCAKLRDRWAEDDEILAMIDAASTHMFRHDGWGSVAKKIEQLLEDRKRATEPELEPDDDDPDHNDLDLDGRRASWEDRQRVAEERNKAIVSVSANPQAWLKAQLAADNNEVRSGLISWALDDVLCEYDVDAFLPWFGIDPPGEDEDVDDANRRIVIEACELTYADQISLLALAITGAALTVGAWAWKRQVEHFVDHLGYQPSDAETALLGADA